MTEQEQRELELLRAKVQQMEAAQNKPLKFKVSEKGGVSVYGLGRFPVTLYKEQWERLLAATADLQQFITVNAGSLKTKGE